jgi:hypothetical protein
MGTVIFILAQLVAASLLIWFLVRAFDPAITNKAGPNWMWWGGKFDTIRNIFFKQDGSFRRNARAPLVALLIPALLFSLYFSYALVWTLVSQR